MQFDVRVRLTEDDASIADARPFAEGIVQSLAIRGRNEDHAVVSADDDLWASAWAQTRMLERPQEINTIDASGVSLVHLYSDHDYGASFVPYLRDVIDIGPQGALVSMPLIHSVVVHAITDVSLVRAAQAMIPITRQVHRSGPSALSPHVYWWHDGGLTWIPTSFGRDGIEFHAPHGLANLIIDQD